MGVAATTIIKVAIVGKKSAIGISILRYLAAHPNLVVLLCAESPAKLLQKAPKLKDLDIILVAGGKHPAQNNRTILALHQYFSEAEIIYFAKEAPDTEHIIEAIQSGASGYIPTGTTPRFFLHYFDYFLVHGGLLLPPVLILQITLKYYPLSPENYLHFGFTPTQYEILAFIQKGFSPLEIAKHQSKSLDLIQKHLKHIFSKIDLQESIQLK